jgi:soluble lytic murein transglycosylase
MAAWECSLYGAALYIEGRLREAQDALEHTDTPWSNAVATLARFRESGDKAPLLNLLLNSATDGGTTDGGAIRGAYTWVSDTIAEEAEVLTKLEKGLIEARLMNVALRYNAALALFRVTLAQDQQLFWQYPALLNDLGRSFQYTAIAEGVATFLQWETLLRTSDSAPTLAGVDIPALRYQIYYFLGRFERQRSHYKEAFDYFSAALSLAPDIIQEDACIWYLLSLTLANKPEDVPALIALYQARWHDDLYFNDILSPLCRYLTAERKWIAMLDVFLRIRFGDDHEIIAQYAYILARALGMGYLSADEAKRILRAAPSSLVADSVEDAFYRIAFEEAQASLYYRALSASHLKTSVELAPATKPDAPTDSAAIMSDDLAFLLGFFEAGAGQLALPFLNRMRDTLSIPELRRVAGALSENGQWLESIRLLGAYMSRYDYELTRADIELYYPRPFRDIIEKSARDMDIPPQLLYGLIRTESAFEPGIASHAGAVGLAQLMPATALEEARRIAKKGGPDFIHDGIVAIEDPEANVYIGASYLKSLINTMESPMLALLGYNGGPTRVRRLRNAERKLPADLFLETISIAETRNYGKRVSAAAAMYGYLYFDLGMEAVVADIFK